MQDMRKVGEVGMSESRPKKRKVEFIESYWTGGEHGSDYQWNDNHGELIRCKDCKHWVGGGIDDKDNFIPSRCKNLNRIASHDWFCADGERRNEDVK